MAVDSRLQLAKNDQSLVAAEKSSLLPPSTWDHVYRHIFESRHFEARLLARLSDIFILPVDAVAQLIIVVFFLLLTITEYGPLVSATLLIGYPFMTTYVYPDEATSPQNLCVYLFCYILLTFFDRYLDVIPGYYVLKIVLMSLLFLEPGRLVERKQKPAQNIEFVETEIIGETTTPVATVSNILPFAGHEVAGNSALFFLPGLDPVLLEKVITKMDSTSYFRLQQTCHGMYDFIRRCHNISVYLDGDLSPDRNGYPWRYRSRKNRDEESAIDDIGLLHGTRLRELNIWPEIKNYNDLLSLEQKHISCKRLAMGEATFDQLQHLLTFLDPEEIRLDSYDERNISYRNVVDTSNNYKALFQARTLKKVHLRMNHRNALVVAPQLMARFSDIFLSVELGDDGGGLLDATRILKPLLRILQHGTFPQLRKFDMETFCDGPLPELPIIQEEFSGFPLEDVEYGRGPAPDYYLDYKALMKLPPGNLEEYCAVGLCSVGSVVSCAVFLPDDD